MSRKLLLLSAVLVFSVVFSNTAWSSVEGTWDVSGVVSVKVSAKGMGSGSETAFFNDIFTFGNDGSFEMIGVNGTYLLNKNKFTVYLFNADIENSMASDIEDILGSYGFDVDVRDVIVAKSKFKGSEDLSNGTISGTFKLSISMSIYFYDIGYEFSGKASAAASFIGTARLLGSNKIQSAPEAALTKNPLAEIICDEILKSISSPETALPR